MQKEIFTDIFSFIYGREKAQSIVPKLLDILENCKLESVPDTANKLPFTHKDAFLISYGNMLSAKEATDNSGETGLARLNRFLEKRNKGSWSYLHILPFHPYTSDDGFSVVDYRKIDGRFGS